MINLPTIPDQSQKAGDVKHRVLRGLTLVELMVYLAILSLVSVGIMQ